MKKFVFHVIMNFLVLWKLNFLCVCACAHACVCVCVRVCVCACVWRGVSLAVWLVWLCVIQTPWILPPSNEIDTDIVQWFISCTEYLQDAPRPTFSILWSMNMVCIVDFKPLWKSGEHTCCVSQFGSAGVLWLSYQSQKLLSSVSHLTQGAGMQLF